MAAGKPDPVEHEARLDAIIADFLDDTHSGFCPDRRQWLARYPEFFDELSDFFLDCDELEKIAAGLREATRAIDDDLSLDWLEPPGHPEHLGSLGPYEVIDWVGRGGMGVVFKAFDSPLNRYVAIKVLAPQWSADSSARRRFTRESQAAAAISHPHVVTIHAVGERLGRPYLVMEFISGVSLQQRIDVSGPLEIKEILRIGIQAASGLAAAHAQGLIHRDVKPSNIMLENELARVRLTDFGLARAVDDTRMTQQGTLAGTPLYMAPEQARGEPLDRRADLFSLGSVLYAMCTGRAAFQGATTLEVIRRVCDDQPAPIRDRNPDIPAWLVEIIDRLHAKTPADRFSDANEVALLLERHLARLQDPTLPPVAHPWTRRTFRSEVRRLLSVRGGRRWLAVPALILLGALGATLMAPLLAPAPAQHAQPSPTETPSPARARSTYTRDFRADPLDIASFRVTPVTESSPPKEISSSSHGVRIAVPSTLTKAVGILPPFDIRGDFEVTATYKIISAETPTSGPGVGAELYLRPLLGGAYRKIASISRLLRPGEVCFSAVEGRPSGKEQRYRFKTIPSTSNEGTLRITRVGELLRYFARDGETGEFHPVMEVPDYPSEDLSIRLAAVNGGASSAVTVLWKTLNIVADDFISSTPPASASGNQPSLTLTPAAPRPDRLSSVASRPFASSSLFDTAALKAEYRQDFRENEYDFSNLRIMGTALAVFVKPDRRGLRLTVPEDTGENLSIATSFGLRGDIDVSATFEILKAARPQIGYGVGPELYVRSVDGWGHYALLAQFLQKEFAQPVMLSGHGFQANGKTVHQKSRLSTETKSGTLRIIRRGPTVTYLLADEGKDAFRTLHEEEYGTGDFDMVRLSAVVGGSQRGLEILWKDLTVRAEALPGLKHARVATAKRSPLWILAAGLAAAALLAVGLWRLAHASRKQQTPARPARPVSPRLEITRTEVSTDGWDEDALVRLEHRARAYAESHPDAIIYTERPQFQFNLFGGTLHGAFVAWESIDKATMKRLGQTWEEVREKLARRFEGTYANGLRHGTFQTRDRFGETIVRIYHRGERIG